MTNLYRDEILDETRLPISPDGLHAVFPRGGGAAGKDTRGIIRQHQFQKVELVKFTRPEESDAQHEQLTRDAEEILEALELPYRRVLLVCGRYRVFIREDVRSGSVAAGAAALPGDLFVLELRGVPGAAGQHPLQRSRPGPKAKTGICAHAERQRAGGWPDVAGDSRKLSAGRRVGADSGGSAAVYGRAGKDYAVKKRQDPGLWPSMDLLIEPRWAVRLALAEISTQKAGEWVPQARN